MKGNRQKLSVKVDAKNSFTEDHQEFVRIKRKVLKRIARKGMLKGEVVGLNEVKADKLNIFKHFLQSVTWKKKSPDLFAPLSKSPGKNGVEEEMLGHKEMFGQVEEEPVILTVSDEVSAEIQSDLYMPLQF